MPRKRRAPEDSDDASSASEGGDDDDLGTQAAFDMSGVMVKKFIRLALASEYSRQPIRRNDVSQKVLGAGSRNFKAVFDETQRVLRDVFGMQMVELPVKEAVTVAQRKAAQKAEKQSTPSRAWVLTSTLPRKYRSPTTLPPSKIPSSTTEASYVGLYSFIIAVIMLCGGSIPEQKLERYLRRAGSDMYTPIDQTDKLLARLDKEGYIVRVREAQANEQIVSYVVGPRGKVEVGARGLEGLMKEVYGFGYANVEGTNDEEREDFEERLQKYLKTVHERPKEQARRQPNPTRQTNED